MIQPDINFKESILKKKTKRKQQTKRYLPNMKLISYSLWLIQ